MKTIDTDLPKKLIESFGNDMLQQRLLREQEAIKSQLCLWHVGNSKKHASNFGSDCECLDCMKKINFGYQEDIQAN